MKSLVSADQITPEWLTSVLRQGGYLTQGAVTAVTPQGNQTDSLEGPGFHKRNRIDVRYSSDATRSAPTRLYLKSTARAAAYGRR
jgi:hypothetical protein